MRNWVFFVILTIFSIQSFGGEKNFELPKGAHYVTTLEEAWGILHQSRLTGNFRSKPFAEYTKCGEFGDGKFTCKEAGIWGLLEKYWVKRKIIYLGEDIPLRIESRTEGGKYSLLKLAHDPESGDVYIVNSNGSIDTLRACAGQDICNRIPPLVE